MSVKLQVTIMSGVDDGVTLRYSQDSGDGHQQNIDEWVFTIGRHDNNDICLRNDTFVSRQHARLICRDAQWRLEDCGSTNGTFIETPGDDQRVEHIITLASGEVFRVGRTWLRLDQME